MRLKTLLVVFLLVQSVGFSASLPDFLDVSLLDEGQDNRPVISWMEKPPYVISDEEPLEKKENRTRLASSQPGEAMNATKDNSGKNQEGEEIPPEPPDSIVISWMEKPPYVMFDEEPLEKKENRTRLVSSQPGEAMNATKDNSGKNQEGEEIPPEPPDSIVISWMEKPPYVMFDEEPLEKKENRTRLVSSQPGEAMNATNDNSGINQESVQGSSPGFRVKGIFQEIVYKGLQICTDIPLTKVNFAEKADNLRQLDEIIVKKEADLALPVQGSEDGSYGGHTYVEVLKSPGVVFIVDKQQTLKHLRKRVLQAMKDTWPVIILTLLLAGFAGILIWGLVSVYIFNILRNILLT